ncbi:hypothetical protein AcW1_008944 [Taiwanofungus camphoratus]|nr:hypothetical protein AcW1_008944 [Antrodia cinnamomea]KAI0958893.1 hypothetical protein AcV7_004581 [Antrodia cinnamomea]
MSLQGLISGSECAVPFNPLSQVLKHTEGDRSLQQDRVVGPSSASLRHLPSTSTPAAERDLALARQFFDGNVQALNSGHPARGHHHIPPQIGRLMDAAPRAGPDLTKAWNEIGDRQSVQNQIFQGYIGHGQDPPWAAEFNAIPGVTVLGSVQNGAQHRLDFLQMPYMTSGLYGGSIPYGMLGSSVNASLDPLQGIDKGKGKSKEIDFDAAFAQAAASVISTQTENARIVEVDENISNLADSLQDTRLEGEPDKSNEASTWNFGPSSKLDAAEMSRQIQEANALATPLFEDDFEFDYDAMMQGAWRDGLGDFDIPREDRIKFTGDGLPILEPYIFERENKYIDPSSSRSALQEAKTLLEQNGSLSEVALLLEAAIQQGELGEGGYEAWLLLGETRSMDEREDAAMRALLEGTKQAEQVGASGEGMLSLAISFTNESYERASHTMLLRWLRARFPSYEIPQEAWKSLTQSSWHSHERVTEVFLNLAREQYSRGEMDPDVQIALGVLFYTNNDYARAKDCFEAALTIRPKDYLLWNRLGSSLSNGNKPEEALGAYREALQLRPTYTRAIYNVGVACSYLASDQSDG